MAAPRGSIFLAFVYVLGGGLVPRGGNLHGLVWWGHVPQERAFAGQGFCVVPKTEQGTGIIPFRSTAPSSWGLGHRARFVVPGRAHIRRREGGTTASHNATGKGSQGTRVRGILWWEGTKVCYGKSYPAEKQNARAPRGMEIKGFALVLQPPP